MKSGFCFNCGKRVPPAESYLPKKSFWESSRTADPASLCIRLAIEEGHVKTFFGESFHTHNRGVAWFCSTDCMVAGIPDLLKRFPKNTSNR